MDLELLKAIKFCEGRRVLVVGDIIVDIYMKGAISRISREAPVLILEHRGETLVLGGAGNAASNLQSLSGQALLVGLVGDDPPGRAIRDTARARGIDVTCMITGAGRKSPTKTRIIAWGEHTIQQQLLRVDRIENMQTGEEELARIESFVAQNVPLVEAVIISDYGLDILPLSLYQWVLHQAAAAGKPVVVDSRRQIKEFHGATLLTPNVEEAEIAVGYSLRNEEDLIRAGWSLLEQLQPTGLLITRGPDGMTLFEAGGNLLHIPAANRQEVFDVSGAGDTVVAAVALGLATGLRLTKAAQLANYAAGVVVRKRGTATVNIEELRSIIIEAAASA